MVTHHSHIISNHGETWRAMRNHDGYLGQLVAKAHCIFEKAIRLPTSSDFLLIKTQQKKNAS